MSLPAEERIVDLPDNEKMNANGHALTYLHRSGVYPYRACHGTWQNRGRQALPEGLC